MTDPIAALSDLLGTKGWLSGADTEPYRQDWLKRYGVTPVGVARPANTIEVAQVVRLCRQAGLAVVAQGGNTGLCGAAVAQDANAVILSLARMTATGEPDAPSRGPIDITRQALAVRPDLSAASRCRG